MKKNELRIGNLFDYQGVTVHLMDIKTSGINEPLASFGYFIDSIGFERYLHHEECPKPIPLTEEWLLKFGFTSTINDTYINGKEFVLQRNNLEFNGIGGIGWINKKNDYLCVNTLCRGNYCANSVEYVHELQNLFFALTGEELKVV